MFWQKQPTKPTAAEHHQRFKDKLDQAITDYIRDVGNRRQIASDLERRAADLKMADAMFRPVR